MIIIIMIIIIIIIIIIIMYYWIIYFPFLYSISFGNVIKQLRVILFLNRNLILIHHQILSNTIYSLYKKSLFVDELWVSIVQMKVLEVGNELRSILSEHRNDFWRLLGIGDKQFENVKRSVCTRWSMYFCICIYAYIYIYLCIKYPCIHANSKK